MRLLRPRATLVVPREAALVRSALPRASSEVGQARCASLLLSERRPTGRSVLEGVREPAEGDRARRGCGRREVAADRARAPLISPCIRSSALPRRSTATWRRRSPPSLDSAFPPSCSSSRSPFAHLDLPLSHTPSTTLKMLTKTLLALAIAGTALNVAALPSDGGASPLSLPSSLSPLTSLELTPSRPSFPLSHARRLRRRRHGRRQGLGPQEEREGVENRL